MTGWNEAYPYVVNTSNIVKHTKVTNELWVNVYSWLDQTLPGEWEYFNSEFRFSTERAKMLFMLKWCES